MLDEEQESLAAEYVLGTLSADEREHAEALLTFDSGFEAAVRQWERRLGELNVMVEAVEPSAEVWDKIKKEVSPAEPVAASEPVPEVEAPHVLDAPPAAAGENLPRDLDSDETIAALASDLSALEGTPQPTEREPVDAAIETPANDVTAAPPIVVPEPLRIERGADVIYLANRVRRWRRLTVVASAIAALLAVYVAVWQAAPDLIPPQLRPAGSVAIARSDGTPGAQQDRLVAVLQQGPTAPAFLLTVDPQRRTLVVRRVSATSETGKSYELWLVSNRFSAPRSLGVIGSEEFTQRALPGNYDLETLRSATYAVSLEPTGGSPSGAPTGPVLFTGKAVESLPAQKPAKT
jgi:anti-sigma-K factor RskA